MTHEVWQQLSVLRCRKPQAIEDCLLRHDALSITLEDAADQALLEPHPGQHPLWQSTRISALFTTQKALHAARSDLVQMGVEAIDIITGELPDKDWIRAWMQHYQPLQCGRLHICPSHISTPTDPEAVVIRLDPGLAFGTGTHPTTRLCLQWLEQTDLRNRVVIDYGCGSGILALAAAKLGASKVFAVDHDEQAIQATLENARNNQVDTVIEAGLPATLQLPQADVIIANIIARPLIELKHTLLEHLRADGVLVLSGILSSQADVVAASYLPDLRRELQWEQNDWICMTLRGKTR